MNASRLVPDRRARVLWDTTGGAMKGPVTMGAASPRARRGSSSDRLEPLQNPKDGGCHEKAAWHHDVRLRSFSPLVGLRCAVPGGKGARL